jgi:hypothetical protein
MLKQRRLRVYCRDAAGRVPSDRSPNHSTLISPTR